MRPFSTLYRLSEPGDVHTCKQIWRENKDLFGAPQKLGWPTVVAQRDGRLLGFLSTDPTKKVIVAGPLIVGKNCSAIIVIRLVEAYENIIRPWVNGYYFHVEKKNSHWLKMIRKLDFRETGKSRSGFWFYREFVK